MNYHIRRRALPTYTSARHAWLTELRKAGADGVPKANVPSTRTPFACRVLGWSEWTFNRDLTEAEVAAGERFPPGRSVTGERITAAGLAVLAEWDARFGRR